METDRLASASFSSAIAVNDAALTQIVRRNFYVNTIAWKNLDAVASETSGDVSQNCVAVVELDRERRAGKHLRDAAMNFERRLFGVDVARLGFAGFWCAASSSDNDPL